MAVRGRHRRYQPNRINRASLTVTAGSAGIALPLIGTGVAHAASPDTWNKVAACESSSDWSINSGNGYFGGLQFKQSTWEAYGGTVHASRADLATKDQQIAVAEKVLKGQGPGAWPLCSERAGLERGGQPPATAPRPVTDVKPQTTPQSRAGTAEMYTVVRGDSLSGIAQERKVEGGWQWLYEANRTTVGSDPDMIVPGQRLSLDAPAAKPKPQQPKPADKAAGQQSPDRAQERAKAETEQRTKAEQRDKAEQRKKAEQRDKAAKREKAEAEKREKAEQRAKAEQREKAEKRKEAPAKAEPAGAGRSAVAAPVGAGPSTAYRAAGSSWSKGYHTGVDFAVPTGTSVKSVAAGKVVSAGWGGSYGYQVVIRHADGKFSQYGHLSALTVKSGQNVGAGQRIARSGSTGNSTGPHLHFEMRTGPGFGSDIDPLAYLRAGGVSI